MDLPLDTLSALPFQAISHDVLVEKYLRPEERDARDIYRRVSRALASVEQLDREQWQQRFYDNMLNGAIGAGRIMYAAGTRRHATMLNCFVQPIGDVETGRDQDGYPCVKIALQEALHTMRMGGGVGYDFSRIRPRLAQSLDGLRSNKAHAASSRTLITMPPPSIRRGGVVRRRWASCASTIRTFSNSFPPKEVMASGVISISQSPSRRRG